MLGDSVSVSVVRCRAYGRRLPMVSASVDTGELVMEGDILVVQSMQPYPEAHQKNAALQTDGGVVPVTLADDYIAVGDVLQGDRWSSIGRPAGQSRLPVPRTSAAGERRSFGSCRTR